MSRDPSGQGGSYELLLAADDTRNRRIGLALFPICAIPLALYFDSWAVFVRIALFFPLLIVADIWNGIRAIRTGYVTRGKAMLRGLWETPACAFVLWLVFLVQSKFGFWFAQHDLPNRFG